MKIICNDFLNASLNQSLLWKKNVGYISGSDMWHYLVTEGLIFLTVQQLHPKITIIQSILPALED